mgnify:CR=1 FL=1
MRTELIATLQKTEKKAIQIVKMWTDPRLNADGAMVEHENLGIVEVSFYVTKAGEQKIFPVRAVYFPKEMAKEIKSYL